MKTGAVVALIAIPVVLGGGVAAFFLLRKRGQAGAVSPGVFQVTPRQDNRDLAAAQMVAGPAAVASSGGGGGLSVTGLAKGVVGGVMDKYMAGTGKYAGAAVGAATSILKSVPGLGSLGKKFKLW